MIVDTETAKAKRLQLQLRIAKIVQLIDPTLRESINPQQMFQHLESCHPTPTLDPNPLSRHVAAETVEISLSSLKVEILRKITSILAEINEKTLITY